MIKSRLLDMSTTVTVAVKEKTLASGQHSESNVTGMSALTATKRQPSAQEVASSAGAVVMADEIFLFDAIAGASLPAIKEEYVLVDTNSLRYEIKSVRDGSAGEGELLIVVTERGR